uniref:Uncharacterized protein n=1 Tax=Eutreptiella gymnastica TaxID=73025 RepID=A0A7S4FVF8_9EUGL
MLGWTLNVQSHGSLPCICLPHLDFRGTGTGLSDPAEQESSAPPTCAALHKGIPSSAKLLRFCRISSAQTMAQKGPQRAQSDRMMVIGQGSPWTGRVVLMGE